MNEFFLYILCGVEKYDDGLLTISVYDRWMPSRLFTILVTSSYRLDDRITRANVSRAKKVAPSVRNRGETLRAPAARPQTAQRVSGG